MGTCLNCFQISRRIILLFVREIIFTLKYFIMFFFSKDIKNKLKFMIKGHRRLIGFSILLLLFCTYTAYVFLPFNFSFNQEYIKTSSLSECLNNRLQNYRKKIIEMDAVEYELTSDQHYYSFIGNGYFGLSLNPNKIVIKGDKSLSLKSSFSPNLRWSVSNYFHNEKFILDFLSGIFIRFQCYKQSSLCISITNSNYAHRTRRELLIQELRVHNPTKATIQIAMNYEENNRKNLKLEQIVKINNVEYEMFSEKILLNKTQKNIPSELYYVVVFAKPVLPKFINVPASKDDVFQHIIGVKYSGLLKSNQINYENETKSLIKLLFKTLSDAINVPINMLKKEHETAWKSIWETGISIDKSLAPSALNGHQINSTIYYLLSNTESFLNRVNISEKQKVYYEKFLKQSSHCFSGHDTLYANNLWSIVSKKDEMDNLVNKWFINLHKKGCGLLMKSGAHGMIQAIVYSAGAFTFAGDHISFGMHPNDLQRKLHFRNLQYKDPSSPKFDVIVDLDEENRPQIWVSIRDKTRELYACDAGCVDAPIQLSSSYKMLPVKITKPRQPILYISDQLSHIDDLKHVIQVESIEEAKARNHHIIALHKHGHSWGGLPPLFWCTIILLVVVFHLFLCKVIYTEYCRYRNDYDLSMPDFPSTTENRRVKNHYYIPSTRRSQYYKSLY